MLSHRLYERVGGGGVGGPVGARRYPPAVEREWGETHPSYEVLRVPGPVRGGRPDGVKETASGGW